MASPKKSATKVANDLQKIVGVMKRHLKLWQNAKDEKSRAKHLGHLKKLTKKKKRIEKALEDTVKSIDQNAELELTEVRRYIQKEIKNILKEQNPWDFGDKRRKLHQNAKELIKYFRRRPVKDWSVEEDRHPNDPWMQFNGHKTGHLAMFHVEKGIWYLYQEEAAIHMSDIMDEGTWKTKEDIEKILLKLKG
jgi:Asp-tRNA(Asn)/Glu-tRNA(Gln) amidotransferase C subunit